MNFLRVDGPFMNFIRMVLNYILLQILFVICCIPVITMGAAISAKYSVAMKLVKGEEGGIIKPFFKAFKQNFKQATPIWLLMLVVFFVLFIDWGWVFEQGITVLPIPVVIAIVVVTCFVISVCMVVFPMITRFELSGKQLFTNTIKFVFTNLIKFILIIALMFATLIVTIWYFQWAPVIVIVSTIATTFFIATTLNKEFDKAEKAYKDAHPDLYDEEGYKIVIREHESYEYEDAMEGESYAASRVETAKIAKEASETPDRVKVDKYKDDNKVVRYFKEERDKLSTMTGKQKWEYFVEYYLGMTVLIILLAAGIGWYISDVVRENNYVFTGGTVCCTLTDDGKKYAIDDYLTWGEYKKSKKGRIVNALSEYTSMGTEGTYEDLMTDSTVYAMVQAGSYDFFFMNRAAVDIYSEDDILMDMSTVIDITKVPEELRIYNDKKELVAIELDGEHKEKLGFPKNGTYFIGFLFNSDPMFASKYLDYMFQ